MMKSNEGTCLTRAQRRLESMSAVLLTVLILVCAYTSELHAQPRPPVSAPTTLFYVKNYGGKCLDFGAPPQTSGSPVYIYGCNGTIAQQIGVEEIDSRHDVLLHAGTKVLGLHNPAVFTTGGTSSSPSEYALELQDQAKPLDTNFANQVFALDGDSIIWVANRNYVVQMQNAKGANRSPLVAGTRRLADSEFWDVFAVDGTDKDPTSGFKRVSDRIGLLIAVGEINQLAQQNQGAAWGSVVKITATDQPIDLTPNPAYILPNDNSFHNLVLPTGVTIRGDRRATKLGPQLIGKYTGKSTVNLVQLQQPDAWTALLSSDHILEVEGDYVRITGLRIQGPTGNLSTNLDVDGIHIGNACMAGEAAECGNPQGVAVQLGEPNHRIAYAGVIIDHNEISQWPVAAIGGFSGYNDRGDGKQKDDEQECAHPTYIGPIDGTLVTRNFIHDNARQGLGYGVVIGDAAGITILGNTFLMNRHAIAGDARLGDQYSAWDNLVLSRAPSYGGHIEQDFDMHGTLSTQDCKWWSLDLYCSSQQHDGGIAGQYVEIAWNTFLGGNRINYALRGQPCKVNSFHNNVSMQDGGSAIKKWNYGGDSSNPTSSTQGLTILNNHFSVSNPTAHLGVGDFDGDGIEDLFLATGTTWFYSSAGKSEWRYLNGGKTDNIASLLFGDFDGDGRTDVIGKNGNDVMISWGGMSDWQKINSTTAPITQMAVGDFDGDGRSDLFLTDGKSWYVASAGSGAFTPVATSSKAMSELRFGWNLCGKHTTDVFSVIGGKWQVSCGAKGSWTPLAVSLTNSVDGLVLADFDGDGTDDIAMGWGSLSWRYSHNGAQAWKSHSITATTSCTPVLPATAAVGRFAGTKNADILLWGANYNNNLCVVAGGTGAAQRQTQGDMR